MKTFIVFFAIGLIGFFLKSGEPVSSMEVFIEQEGNRSPIAFQHTGVNGKATFSNLPRGLYSIKVILPQQSGKLMRGKDNIDYSLWVGYDNDRQEYFLRAEEGFFTVCYSKFKKVTNRNMTPVHNLELEKRSKKVVIGKFEVSGSNGSFTMEIRAQKPKTFEKRVQKAQQGVNMITIKNAV